jgi:DNA repair protein RadA
LGLTVLQRLSEVRRKIPIGCLGLDRILRGGFATGELALLYGEAGAGKTTTMIQAATAFAAKGLKVIYVDSDHSFTQQRFDQIAGSRSSDVSELITLFFPETFSEQRRIVESLENYVTSRLGMVIVDSISSLYRAAFSVAESIFSLNRDLTRQVAYLDELASSHNIACLITSQVHSRLKPPVADIEPVARRTVFHFPRLIIRIRNMPKQNVREFVLERIDGTDTVTSCLVSLQENGLTDIPV